eukprot:scaffold33930_cov21-Tisochrysis_lutea.AAC.4
MQNKSAHSGLVEQQPAPCHMSVSHGAQCSQRSRTGVREQLGGLAGLKSLDSIAGNRKWGVKSAAEQTALACQCHGLLKGGKLLKYGLASNLMALPSTPWPGKYHKIAWDSRTACFQRVLTFKNKQNFWRAALTHYLLLKDSLCRTLRRPLEQQAKLCGHTHS